jgi:alpha-N-arabinofuranosidase
VPQDAPPAAGNPVLPGCHPDPSICRVGDDYYLVSSTFEYFPGLPVFHSRGLVHWRQIGHAIDRAGQIDLSGVPSSGGLSAPTLRHHAGVFYLVNPLVGAGDCAPGGNFLLTAVDPAGPWSDPVWLNDAEGTDPSLFFDDDGRAWYVGTRPSTEPGWEGQTDVWLRRLTLGSDGPLRLTGLERVLWHGALLGAVWAEGPHLYKVEGQYYLLAAEGGTEQDHAVCVARADEVTGPYVGNPANPALTHRNLGRQHPIVGAGHADLVCVPDGTWWAVLLAMRPYGGYHYNLGRETFLVPVGWEDGWPVFAPGVGQVTAQVVPPALKPHPWPVSPVRDEFLRPELDLCWNALRGPASSFATAGHRTAGNDDRRLSLQLQPQTFADRGTPAFLGRRQQHRDVDVAALLEVEPAHALEWAGIAARLSDDNHYLLVVAGSEVAGSEVAGSDIAGSDIAGSEIGTWPRRVLAVRCQEGVQKVVAEAGIGPGPVRLTLKARGQDYALGYAVGDGAGQDLVTVDGRVLDPATAGSFVGVWIGLYATSNGRPTSSRALVDWFDYRPA